MLSRRRGDERFSAAFSLTQAVSPPVPRGTLGGMRIGLVGVIYLLVGVFVAASQDYLERLGQLKGILTALLGIFLWPLLLLGIDFRVR